MSIGLRKKETPHTHCSVQDAPENGDVMYTCMQVNHWNLLYSKNNNQQQQQQQQHITCTDTVKGSFLERLIMFFRASINMQCFSSFSFGCFHQGSPQQNIFLHFTLSLASCSVTLIAGMSSQTTSMNFLSGLPLLLLPGTSNLTIPCPSSAYVQTTSISPLLVFLQTSQHVLSLHKCSKLWK